MLAHLHFLKFFVTATAGTPCLSGAFSNWEGSGGQTKTSEDSFCMFLNDSVHFHRAQSLPFLHDSQMSKFAAQLRLPLPPLQHAPLVLSQHCQVWSLFFFKIWIKLGKLCSADRWRGLKDVFFNIFEWFIALSMNQISRFQTTHEGLGGQKWSMYLTHPIFIDCLHKSQTATVSPHCRV